METKMGRVNSGSTGQPAKTALARASASNATPIARGNFLIPFSERMSDHIVGEIPKKIPIFLIARKKLRDDGIPLAQRLPGSDALEGTRSRAKEY